jgi:hypothetical protein
MSERNLEMVLLSICVQTGLEGGRPIPVMVEGLPGGGKTQVIIKLGKEIERLLPAGRKFPVAVFAAPQRMPEEIGGIPVPYKELDEVKCLPMKIGKDLLKAGAGILYIDEYSSASQAMGGACMTAIQDGRLGDLVLPNAVARVCAMNPSDCAVAGRPLTAPESNRFCWIKWGGGDDMRNSWIDYMMGGPGVLANARVLPANWERDFSRRSAGMVTSFATRRPEFFDLERQTPKASKASEPWASFRSWENASRLLAAIMACGYSPTSELADLAVRGCVGNAAADCFHQWLVNAAIPDPEEILKDPKNYQKYLPKRDDQIIVAIESVCAAAVTPQDTQEAADKRYLDAWGIIDDMLNKDAAKVIWAAQILSRPIERFSHLVSKIAALGKLREFMKTAGLTQ